MKKTVVFVWVVALSFLVADQLTALEAPLSITGLVKQPLNLTLSDLGQYQTITVQLNEVMTDHGYRGSFHFKGVPLRTLLDVAYIEKEESDFHKRVDLGLLVRNGQGKQVALSWGEVFYRNRGEIVIATSAVPIMPHHDCIQCHEPEVYQPRLDQLHRTIRFPKLVISNDTYADRSIEGITSIEVVDLRPKMPTKKMDKLFSPEFAVTGRVQKEVLIKDLASYPRREIDVRHLGEGKGYHGIDRFEGACFKAVLEKAGIEDDLTLVFLVSAPDGYRSLFSYGEIFLNPNGERMIIANRMNDEALEKGGKFFLVPPDDLMADRDVKSVQNIEVISLRQTPKLYVIGIGSGDTNLVTLEAVSKMSRADMFVCPPDIRDRFAKYMGGKPVLFNLYDFAPPVLKRENPGLSTDELAELGDKKRTLAAGIIREAIDKDKSVAILDYGDPTIWSGSSYVRELFGDDILEMVPGLSSFNVSNALLKRKLGCNGSIVLTTPRGVRENIGMIRALATSGETLCIFMGIREIPALVGILSRYYSGNTPSRLVYKAGYSASEHLITTTLDGLENAAGEYHEKYLGLIYVGPCLSVAEKRNERL
ncbi:MAG: SAM-dependent methyltransferase [Thermodesulfobacteriota bacterium]|nr:SAM-dependent methyltransferase [Thermodesulfobacteriota bacterium]